LEVMAILNGLVVIALLLGAAVSSSSETCKGEGSFEAGIPFVEVPTTIYDDNAFFQTAVHMSQQPHLENLAEIVEELGTPWQREEASEVESGTADETTIEDVINQFSMEVGSAAAASADDAEVTVDDIASITGVRGEDMCGNCSQGDMIPADAKQQAVFLQIAAKHGSYNWAGNPWTGGIVKYCFAADIATPSRMAFEKGIEMYKKAIPCIQFVNVGLQQGQALTDSYTYTVRGPSLSATIGPCWAWKGFDCGGISSISAALKANCPVSCNTAQYRASIGKCADLGVYVKSEPTNECKAHVGMTGMASQYVQLSSPGCATVGIAMHEMGHTLGMAHEQARPDRDQYVKVDFDNTIEDDQFKIDPKADTQRPYDVLSLMHYGVGDFATDTSKPVIEVKPAGYAKYTYDPSEYHKYKIGNRVGLSQTDVEQLADMYKGTVLGGCVAASMSGQSTCVDKEINGQPYASSVGYGCDYYRQNSIPNPYCCGSPGGGWQVQSSGSVSPGAAVSAPTPPQVSAPTPPTASTATTQCWDTSGFSTDKYGDSCAGYAKTPSWCAGASAYSDSDFTATTVCCACGGGVTL